LTFRRTWMSRTRRCVRADSLGEEEAQPDESFRNKNDFGKLKTESCRNHAFIRTRLSNRNRSGWFAKPVFERPESTSSVSVLKMKVIELSIIFLLVKAVFFNLFEVAEHKMTSKKFAEPKLSSKNLCGTQITLKKVKNSS
jgi:hypothetical protein